MTDRGCISRIHITWRKRWGVFFVVIFLCKVLHIWENTQSVLWENVRLKTTDTTQVMHISRQYYWSNIITRLWHYWFVFNPIIWPAQRWSEIKSIDAPMCNYAYCKLPQLHHKQNGITLETILHKLTQRKYKALPSKNIFLLIVCWDQYLYRHSHIGIQTESVMALTAVRSNLSTMENPLCCAMTL